MFTRLRIAIGLALLLTLAFAIPVFAGGWAVITLDQLPTGVAVGEPIKIGFTVLQHGKTPMNDLDPTVTAKLSLTEKFVVSAEPEGEAGHYAATLTFPKEGNWEWSVQAFSMDQVMPALNVAAPIVAPVSQQPIAETAPISAVWIVRILALLIGFVGLTLAFWRKSRLAVALTVACLLIGVGSFVARSTVPAVEAESKSSFEMPSDSPMSQTEYGQQLFVVKGCVTCHVNSKILNTNSYQTIDMGAPDLSKFSASPEVLRIRLKDPKLAKSDSQMPNLNLSDEEIEALIAFINSK